MSLGLQLRGVLRQTVSHDPVTLQTLETWFRRECQPLVRDARVSQEDSTAVLLIELHPAAESLRLWFENDVEMVVSAQTTSVGPGYHVYVCDLLKHLSGDFGIHWDEHSEEEGDETGYFESGDESALGGEMLAWLGAVCDAVLRESDSESEDFLIAMSMGVSYKADQFLITPMGSRSRAWAEAVARDPSLGKDFFAWWNPGFSAEYYLGRALCLMWTAVRWRSPLIETESQILNEVRENLDLAYQLDRTLEYPWREWTEIGDHLGTAAVVPASRDRREQLRPMIGYRRNPVRVSLVAGWTIEIPGRFAEAWEDDTWCAWDSDITVWFTAFRLEKDDVRSTASEILSDFKPDSEEIVTHETERILGKGSICWVAEERYWRLRARSATEGRFSLCTICYPDTQQKPVVLEIWRSLRV